MAVVGARAVGKTTTAMARSRTLLAVDEPAIRSSLTVDPDFVLRDAPKPVVIDEWQMAPEVIGAVTRAVDRGTEPGTFIITGSADPRAGMHAAAGRIVRIPMHPLTQLEIESRDPDDLAGRAEGLAIVRLFGSKDDDTSPPGSASLPSIAVVPGVTKVDVIERIIASGFPAIARAGIDDRLRADWVDSYLSAALAVDPDSGAVDGRRLRRYLDAVRATTGMVVTDQSLREAADIATNTARSYQDLLARLHVVEEVPAWGGAALAHLLKAPKRFVVDAALSGLDRDQLLADPTALGPVLETFVHAQLAPLGALGPRPFDVFHLRTAGGHREVDFILQSPSGDIVAVEVKAAAGAQATDARHLNWLRDALGDRFLGGFVLHLGASSSMLDDRLWSMPVSALWQPAGRENIAWWQ